LKTIPHVNITIDRVKKMDDREMYNVSDAYVKGRLSRFAVDPQTQAILHQRELPKHERELSLNETDDTFNAVKQQIYEILYSRDVLPRHQFALKQMRKSVEAQLAGSNDPEGSWRRSAQSFLDMVKDEIGRADVVLEQHREDSATRYLDVLLRAINDHKQAEDADEADERLYEVAKAVGESVFELT
jgi:hypothetical protein